MTTSSSVTKIHGIALRLAAVSKMSIAILFTSLIIGDPVKVTWSRDAILLFVAPSQIFVEYSSVPVIFTSSNIQTSPRVALW
jgi:hypothetical protein